MKHASLITILLIAIVAFSCGKKEEKKENLDNKDNEIIDATIDTSQNYASYEEFVTDGSDDGIAAADSSDKKDMVFIDPTDEIQIDPPVVKKEEVKKEQKKEVKKEVKKEPVIEKENAKGHELRFYIVVGSFKNYSNAQNLNAYFKTKGYSPLILPKENGYNRVAVSSYPQEADAREAIQKLRKEHNDLTFWLYKW
jgi:cell division septation protein DedD